MQEIQLCWDIEGSYALIGIVKGLVILLLCVIELLAICLMGNSIDYIDI